MHMEQEWGGLWRTGSECLTGCLHRVLACATAVAAETQVQSSAPGLATPPWTATRLRDGHTLATPSTKADGWGGGATPSRWAGYTIQGRLTMMNGRPLFLLLF